MFGLWYLIMFALLVLRIVLLVKDKDVLDGVIGVGIIFFIMTLSIPAARNNSKKEVIEIEAFIQQSELTDKTVNYDLRNKYNNKIIDWISVLIDQPYPT